MLAGSGLAAIRYSRARLKLGCSYRILAPFSIFAPIGEHRGIKEEAMRKVLLLALVAMFLGAAACSKS
jgi:hypothetical protein